MAAVEEPEGTIVVATSADLRAAIRNALDRAGCTFEQLAAQARSGDFTSIRARLAWVAIGDLYGADLEQEF
ncbi:MAG: hypothetical protein KDB44_15840 [Mycobacterium sp.]|nr:hypothetical protein [Mycobacterium sp.]